MASTQVLPSSAASTRKQEHLEAGKKRLEEFRRKKAEGRAKKAASTGQLQSVEVDQYEKFSQNNENVSGGATPGGDVTAAKKPSVTVIDCDEKVINFVRETDTSFSNEAHANLPVGVNNAHASYNDLRKEARKDELSMSYGSVNFAELANGYYDHGKNENGEPSHHRRPRHGPTNGTEVNGPPASSSVHTYPSIQVINDHIQVKDNHSSPYSLVEAQSEENKSSLKGNMADTETSAACLMSTFTGKLGSGNEQYSLEFPSTVVNASSDEPISGVEQHNSIRLNHENLMNFDTGRSKIADSISRHLNVDSSPWHASEPSSTDLSSAFKSSSNQHLLPSTGSGTTAGRSRPSFLDSLGVPRISSTPYVLFSEPEKSNLAGSNSKLWSSEIHLPTSQQQELDTVEQSFRSRSPNFNTNELTVKSSVSLNEEQEHVLKVKDLHAQMNCDLPVMKRDEDFAALEQHIEDLTQEKFSLQRALDTSRGLAESLAAENSSLTDSYNQQGKVVSQLKSDMEKLEEEIKAQLLALDSVNVEYANAQLECNAADERAKILASEVIGLEEKALRLRSNELKLEKQLENLNSEITSYKRKVSSLEKERRDFQSTIDALQEEKKLLQSKLRKASANGNVADIKMASSNRKDACTSTDDLGPETPSLVDGQTSTAESMVNSTIYAHDIRPSVLQSSNFPSFSVLPEDTEIHLLDTSSDVPQDQLRMIDNIRSLISELALEKEELMRALTIELSNNSELKELNKDLSKRLEVQTQRLELLTAQRMATENVMARPIDTRSVNDTMEYADEGDEVVERVLGWIMKLFPGGPAKRRTSKLL